MQERERKNEDRYVYMYSLKREYRNRETKLCWQEGKRELTLRRVLGNREGRRTGVEFGINQAFSGVRLLSRLLHPSPPPLPSTLPPPPDSSGQHVLHAHPSLARG